MTSTLKFRKVYVYCSKCHEVVKMSVSRRIKKDSEKATDELQAKIVLERGKKIPKIEIIDNAIRFARKNEVDFINFLIASEDEREKDSPNPLDFILEPVVGALPEDFREYDFDDLEETE